MIINAACRCERIYCKACGPVQIIVACTKCDQKMCSFCKQDPKRPTDVLFLQDFWSESTSRTPWPCPSCQKSFCCEGPGSCVLRCDACETNIVCAGCGEANDRTFYVTGSSDLPRAHAMQCGLCQKVQCVCTDCIKGAGCGKYKHDCESFVCDECMCDECIWCSCKECEFDHDPMFPCCDSNQLDPRDLHYPDCEVLDSLDREERLQETFRCISGSHINHEQQSK